jgi:hypothetical protein
MSRPVIFRNLPATFPEQDKHKMPAAGMTRAVSSSGVMSLRISTASLFRSFSMRKSISNWVYDEEFDSTTCGAS